MPNFYNTGLPTPQGKNTINSVTVTFGIRDFLLHKNILPVYPQLPMTLNGSPKIGEPVLDTMQGTGNVLIPIGLPLEVVGLQWKDMNVINNIFQNDFDDASTLIEIDYLPKTDNPLFGDTEWPHGTQSYPTSATDDVSQHGLLGKTDTAGFRKRSTIKNLYLDVEKQIDMADFITLNPMDVSRQLPSYLDEHGNLNLGDNKNIDAINIIGSLVNGQGLGLTKGGVVPNFDIRASLAGRVLGATGLITDTKLGQIGGQQLALALANNAAFNVQQDILGSLNIQENVLSLIKGQGFTGVRPNYKITVPSSTFGRVAATAGRILGFELPRSFLDDSGSLFQTESGQVGNIDRANKMLLNTGKGQIQALLTNIRANQIGSSPTGIDNPSNTPFRSGYAAAYTNNKGETQITDGILYAFSQDGKVRDLFSSEDGIIANLSYMREKLVSDAGFTSPDESSENSRGSRSNASYNDRKVSDITFSWNSAQGGMVNSTNEGTTLTDDGTNKKSLLVKTQKLFNSVGMVNIVSTKGDMFKESSQVAQANGGGFSKGNAVLQSHLFNLQDGTVNASSDRADQTYCRSWTTFDRYDTVRKLVRSGTDQIHRNENEDGKFEEDNGIYTKNVPYRSNQFGRGGTNGTILDRYGFPQIAPYTDDKFDNNTSTNFKVDNPKKYMFSIENLAWNDNIEDLPRPERGTGDLLTGKKGRIMWFPPYNIQFSESSSVNWESNNFIGRGEPVYTYNNTERSGTLSFQIIVDHPSYINAFRAVVGQNGPDDHYVNSFWAGCIDPYGKFSDKLTVTKTESIIKNKPSIVIPKKNPKKGENIKGIKVFFPNDNSNILEAYENGLSGSTFAEYIDYTVSPDGSGFGLPTGSVADTTKKNVKGQTSIWPDRYNFGFNYSVNSDKTPIFTFGTVKVRGFFDPLLIPTMAEHLTQKCPFCRVVALGYATVQGFGESNVQLGKLRAQKTLKRLKDALRPYYQLAGFTKEQIDKRFPEPKNGTESDPRVGCPRQLQTDDKTTPEDETNPATDPWECKIDRVVNIDLIHSDELAEAETPQPETITVDQGSSRRVTTTDYDIYDETKFFDRLTDKDKFVFDTFREKIKYFHPAFHSTTPEGLNSRLTFLLQCTRQGRTLESQGANNLAFGRPPVCILRIGDFYNTKIVMDSVGITYEPLVWDLNPEGIGVQPMIANVDISFKFLGGSTLMGPINKLQNALSFNYFANCQVYDPRANYLSKDRPFKIETNINGEQSSVMIGETSKTGYYLHDITDKGISIVEGENSETVDTLIEGSKNSSSQIVGNESELSSSPPDAIGNTTTISAGTTGTTVTITELKFTNCDFIRVTPTVIDGVHNIRVGWAQQGMYRLEGSTSTQIATDTEMIAFSNKGVKIRIAKGETIIEEKILTFENDGINLLATGFFQFGDSRYPGFDFASALELSDYVITLFYNGQRVGSQTATVNGQNFYFNA